MSIDWEYYIFVLDNDDRPQLRSATNGRSEVERDLNDELADEQIPMDKILVLKRCKIVNRLSLEEPNDE